MESRVDSVIGDICAPSAGFDVRRFEKISCTAGRVVCIRVASSAALPAIATEMTAGAMEALWTIAVTKWLVPAGAPREGGGGEHPHCYRAGGVASRLLQWVRANMLAAPWSTRTAQPERDAGHDADAAEQCGNVVDMRFEARALRSVGILVYQHPAQAGRARGGVSWQATDTKSPRRSRRVRPGLAVNQQTLSRRAAAGGRDGRLTSCIRAPRPRSKSSRRRGRLASRCASLRRPQRRCPPPEG